MTGSTSRFRIKLTVLAGALVAIALILFLPAFQSSEGSTTTGRPVLVPPGPVPSDVLIDDFDKVLQQRFLTMPMFGLRRIIPVKPVLEAAHLEHFSPSTPEEYAAVAAFEREGWDVGVYLFGRRVQLRTDTKEKEKYDIKYRLFNPIPVTKGIKRSRFRKSRNLAEDIKRAFLEFQKPGGPNENELRFDFRDWSYVARPVRAVNQSCVQCHKDYVITDKIAEGKFTVRERRIGDVNGILVYAFAKRDR